MTIELTRRQQTIIGIIDKAKNMPISGIHARLPDKISMPTLNREIASLVKLGYLHIHGSGRATTYSIAPGYKLFAPYEMAGYFDASPDNRNAATAFSFELMEVLSATPLMTAKELAWLASLKSQFQQNIASISPMPYQKELERLTIELSWKSSQIEGNTYSLLETERLFVEHLEAQGKPRDDAQMLLNHKACLEFILSNQEIGSTLSVPVLEDIHSMLIQKLGVNRNMRLRMVGITGSAYKPLDNQHQIEEAVRAMCRAINAKENAFEKALLAVLLISYIQPFEDGNKRTGRMISNAILIADHACPLSYRSVDSLEYKKAMLLFYEQHNVSAFKQLFLQQIDFAVNNYFR